VGRSATIRRGRFRRRRADGAGDFIRAQFEAWGHVVKEIGIQPE
jgi:hypothetical protein